MMKDKIDIFILLFIISIVSCKNGNPPEAGIAAKKKADSIAKVLAIQPINGVRSDTVIRSSFDNPVAIANNKYSHFDQILMLDLCKDFWHYDGGIDGSTSLDETDLAGLWLQFFEDGRYEKGQYNRIATKGKFTVDNLGFIEFIASDKSEPNSEYQAKFNNDMLILVGTQKHRDNNKQYKLSRIAQRPKK